MHVCHFSVLGTPEMSVEDDQFITSSLTTERGQTNSQMHPPLSSSSNSSTAPLTRPYSSVQQGRASVRTPTWSACIARNQGSFSVDSSPRENAPDISGGGAHTAGRRARAQSTCFECGVGVTKADATRLCRGIGVVDAIRL